MYLGPSIILQTDLCPIRFLDSPFGRLTFHRFATMNEKRWHSIRLQQFSSGLVAHHFGTHIRLKVVFAHFPMLRIFISFEVELVRSNVSNPSGTLAHLSRAVRQGIRDCKKTSFFKQNIGVICATKSLTHRHLVKLHGERA